MISILIATYGSDEWDDRGYGLSLVSALHQQTEVIPHHEPAGTIATSRNAAAAKATRPWLCFLDADDELHPWYTKAMLAAIERNGGNPTCLLTPKVQFQRNGRARGPARFMPKVDYRRGNYLIIGTLIHRGLFNEIGGFADEPRYGAWEDWHFWARAQLAGGQVIPVHRAVYIAHQEPTSRHRSVDHATRTRWHYEVGHDLWPDIYNEQWQRKHMKTPK